MKVEVKNPNNYIRSVVLSSLSKWIVEDEEIFNISNMIEELKEKDYNMYKLIISVFYCDFWLLNRFDLLDELEELEQEYEYSVDDMLEFRSADDVVNYLENYPELLDEMVASAITFNSMLTNEKRPLFLNDKETDKYLFNINHLYLYDKIEYSQLYDKDYLFWLYKDYISENKEYNYDMKPLKVAAREYIREFLLDIKDYDMYNYNLLLLEIIKDFYILEKYKLLNKTCTKENKKLVYTIEKRNFDNLSKLSNDDSYFLTDIIISFVEFNEKDDIFKEKATKKVLNNLDGPVKEKLFTSKYK